MQNGRESQYCEFLEFLGRRGSTHELLGSRELLGPDVNICMAAVGAIECDQAESRPIGHIRAVWYYNMRM